ncbi:hypothetical protein HH303_12200 [Rhodospirillaceae bacterium KN72]|uniref:Uncharacterized protein n=1 Tax=Pacificispira spongiicola TaxID=2729598 RepID=A0A7Y0HEZ4_9PROT|nr:hypothetical protein [Pacificispira spongiicola]NMM45245.1 hypothetical protein [Pacificispira spongiicola]
MKNLFPIILAVVGVLVIFGFAASIAFGVEIVFWIALILVPIVFAQTLLWGR